MLITKLHLLRGRGDFSFAKSIVHLQRGVPTELCTLRRAHFSNIHKIITWTGYGPDWSYLGEREQN